MCKDEIRVWFCSPDVGFVQAVTRALGPGFLIEHSDELILPQGSKLEGWADVVLLDLRAASSDGSLNPGLRLLETINRVNLPPPVIAILAGDEHTLTLKVVENGAYDVLASPPDMVELRLILRRAYKYCQTTRELQQLRSQDRLAGRLHELIGSSECMQQVFALAQKVAPCDVTLLITGETGTGKELLARAIHRMSARAAHPFVAFSCANLPETLIEDELFGHEKGAFTGALMARRGRLEMADRGTLFLDEVGDLGLGLQPKLLRVLQERTFERLGGNTPIAVNLRLLCATNQNLEEMGQSGKFREDLYYRLNVVQLHMPPLRERRDDIPFLAHHFLHRFAQQFGKKSKRFCRLAMQALEEYVWPGNVRELENVVQRAVVLAEGPSIEVWHLPSTFRKGFEQTPLAHSYEGEVREFKRRLILRTLRECSWRKTDTARRLGMARNYLHRLINQLDIRSDAEEGLTELPVEPGPPFDRVM
ncbi:MAG: sigma-54-dependent Fis family transcriptional regulator [Acidobacteria bacterium]|nr:sigma-54-dependent Fis family transcriptional regulator [Acidobacteriota bacterium]